MYNQFLENSSRRLVIDVQESVKIIPQAFVDASVKNAKVLDSFRFERLGFFLVDRDTIPAKVLSYCVIGDSTWHGKIGNNFRCFFIFNIHHVHVQCILQRKLLSVSSNTCTWYL